MSTELKQGDLSGELWREYELSDGPNRVTYRIDEPKTMFYRYGGSTQRIVDAKGVVHLVPGPGYRACVIRWMPRDPSAPVQF